MKSIDDLLESYSRKTEVRPDFEDNVFSKIKKGKIVRKTTYSAFFVLAFLTVLASLLLFIPDSNQDSRQAKGFYESPGSMLVKEEVPVIEDIFFASYDTDTSYAIEQVSNSEDDEGI
jgi:hypothetical protein